MNNDRGTIFLSHSSLDKGLVEAIYKRLDSTLTFYDIKSIEPGAKCIEAMRNGVSSASVFVLFHSPNSMGPWVTFEKELAEMRKIASPETKIIVVPIGGSTYASLPDWMKAYMTTTEGYGISDIVRTIAHLQSQATGHAVNRNSIIGREELLRRIDLDIRKSSSIRGKPVQHIFLSGLPGMGRSTAARQIVDISMPATRVGGPEIDLPDMSEGVDLYLRLREDLDGPMDSGEIATQIEAFNKLSDDEQGSFILKQLSHWASLNQVIILKSRWGFRDRTRSLKPWIRRILLGSEKIPALRVIYVSGRRLPDDEVATYPNVVQYPVEALTDHDIEFLLSRLVDSRIFDPYLGGEIARHIFGHPATAHHVAFLANGGSILLLECAIEIEQRNFELLPMAVEAARSAGREFDARQLLARRAIAEGNWREALEHLETINIKDALDLQLEIRVLAIKKRDPLVQRDAAAIADIESRHEELMRLTVNAPHGFRDA